MAAILHHRRLAPLVIVMCLVVAPLTDFALGVRPAGATLANHSGGHTASCTCNGALPAGTVIGMAATQCAVTGDGRRRSIQVTIRRHGASTPSETHSHYPERTLP